MCILNPNSVLGEINVLTWLQPLLYNRGKHFYVTMYRKSEILAPKLSDFARIWTLWNMKFRFIIRVNKISAEFYVYGSVHREWTSIIVQRDATIYSFIIFLQTALHVSDDTLIHHQEQTQNIITTSGTSRTVFGTVRWRQRTVANTVRPVPEVITVWACS